MLLEAVPALSWCGEVSLGGIRIIISTTINSSSTSTDHGSCCNSSSIRLICMCL